MKIISTVAKGSKDSKGRLRKWIEVPARHSDKFQPGDVVIIQKLKIES